jgi:hypothetical protein
VLFEQLGEKTKITFRQFFETSAVRDQIQQRAMRGNEENLERLAKFVAGKQTA